MLDVAHLFPRGSYLCRFFAEKDIPERTFTVQASPDAMTHYIPNECVVEAIAQTSGAERRTIENTLRGIDARNGDVNHYLAHLARGLAASYDAV